MEKREFFSTFFRILDDLAVNDGECHLSVKDKYEYNFDNGEINLLRTSREFRVNIAIIVDHRKASVMINKVDEISIKDAVLDAIKTCETVESDCCYKIAPHQGEFYFYKGEKEPDLDKMYDVLDVFCQSITKEYPKYNILQANFLYNYEEITYGNTNGTYIDSSRSFYENLFWGSAKEGDKTTSSNFSPLATSNIDVPLLDQGDARFVIENSIKELESKPLNESFIGDIIVVPFELLNFLQCYSSKFLMDGSIISKSSRLIDKLDTKVMSDKITWRTLVDDEQMAGPMMITSDGFVARDLTIVDEGVLKSFRLTYYAASKSGFIPELNDGYNIEVLPGDKSLNQIISETKKGIIVGRSSGGTPSANGDFNFVAKNSFYVEDGVIKYPLTDVMFSGNLYEMFNEAEEVSAERVNNGFINFPYVKFNNINITG